MNEELMSCIAILGEYDSTFTPHVATGIAIRHSSAVLGTAIKGEWVSTQDIDESLFSRYSGLWVAPGSPYKILNERFGPLSTRETNGPQGFSYSMVANLNKKLTPSFVANLWTKILSTQPITNGKEWERM